MAAEAKPAPSFAFQDDSTDSKVSDNKGSLPIKLVIYDFDQTITCLHLYNVLWELQKASDQSHALDNQEEQLKKMSDERLQQIFGGSDRIKRLREHFKRVSSRCELAILSFGFVEVITESLKRMQLFEHFSKSIIIGRDSEEFKTASSEKKECICKMKKQRTLKSTQIIFVDDSKQNIGKSKRYCDAMLIDPATGMSEEHMQSIEEKCGYTAASSGVEVSTPRTVKGQISKHYPTNSAEKKEESQQNNPLAKYAVKDVPQWFDKLTNPDAETPVIQVGGDQTPGSDSEYELNVPMLNAELGDIVNRTNNALSSDDDDHEQNKGPMLSLDTNQISTEAD